MTGFQGGNWGRWIGLLLAVLLWGAAAPPAHSQELACRVQIDRSQLSGSDYGYLDDLERRVEEYLNTQNWTDDSFLPHERIACSLQIILQQAVQLSTFDARLILSTRRPIYGTGQSTVVLRINDTNWRFEYSRGTSLNFDPDRYDPLTSTLDFYAYVMLGYDYDTFSELGGTPYFEQARAIADRANGSGDPGWSSLSNQRNRLQLINEILEQRHQPLRRAYYQYHLNGLDRFVEAPEEARTAAYEALGRVQEVSQSVSRSYVLDLFFSTKYQELTALFQDGRYAERAYSRLVQLDPSHSTEYNTLTE